MAEESSRPAQFEMSHQFDRIGDKLDAAREEASARDREDQRWKGRADEKMDTLAVDLTEMKRGQENLTEGVRAATQSITVMETEKASDRRWLGWIWKVGAAVVGALTAAIGFVFKRVADIAGP